MKNCSNMEYVNNMVATYVDSEYSLIEIKQPYNDDYYIKGYMLIDSSDRFQGAIMFEDSMSSTGAVLLFDKEGKGTLVEDSRESTIRFDEYDHLSTKNLTFTLNPQTMEVSALYTNQNGAGFTGKVYWEESGLQIYELHSVPLTEQQKSDVLFDYFKYADELDTKTFIALSADKKDELEISKSEKGFIDAPHSISTKPIGGFWGSTPSDSPNSVSEWHSFCIEGKTHMNACNYVSEFTLTPDAAVLYIKDASDLERIAQMYPLDNLQSYYFSESAPCSGRVDWNKVAQDFDAFVVDGNIPGWDVPTVVVFNPESIATLETVSIEEYAQAHGKNLEEHFQAIEEFQEALDKKAERLALFKQWMEEEELEEQIKFSAQPTIDSSTAIENEPISFELD